uniref:Uncharacterized protein n=1 Tax=Equus asinus asinus TaxID=83772 RepID=A0A8C4PV31_EQUAS
MDKLGSRCPLPGYPRPSVFICLLVTSFLTYPMLKTLSLQLHSTVTGSYVSGTYSIILPGMVKGSVWSHRYLQISSTECHPDACLRDKSRRRWHNKTSSRR